MLHLGTFLLAFSLIVSTPVQAQSTAPGQAAKPSSWQFEATPYLWGLGLSGDVGIGRLSSSGVQASFNDILGVLDLGLMGTFEGRRNRQGFLVDAFYARLSDTVPTPNNAFGDADTQLTDQFYTLAGTYRSMDSKTVLDIVYGTRYSSLSTDIELTGGIAPGRQGSDTQTWWDGIVGLRARWPLGKHWGVNAYSDFGIGPSNFTWEALAGGSYSFEKLVSLKFGYRYLSIDYDHSDFKYDMDMAGPYFGVGFRF